VNEVSEILNGVKDLQINSKNPETQKPREIPKTQIPKGSHITSGATFNYNGGKDVFDLSCFLQ
jgi:hypothetical protein